MLVSFFDKLLNAISMVTEYARALGRSSTRARNVVERAKKLLSFNHLLLLFIFGTFFMMVDDSAKQFAVVFNEFS